MYIYLHIFFQIAHFTYITTAVGRHDCVFGTKASRELAAKIFSHPLRLLPFHMRFFGFNLLLFYFMALCCFSTFLWRLLAFLFDLHCTVADRCTEALCRGLHARLYDFTCINLKFLFSIKFFLFL